MPSSRRQCGRCGSGTVNSVVIDWSKIGEAVALLMAGASTGLIPWLRSRKKSRQYEEQWDGSERRSRREVLTGSRIVYLLEEGECPMPRQWIAFVDSRASHKANNVVNPLVGQIARLEGEVREVHKLLNELNSTVNRIIGRLLPNEPVS